MYGDPARTVRARPRRGVATHPRATSRRDPRDRARRASGPRRGGTSWSISRVVERVVQVLEESLHLADVPAGRPGDVRRRVSLLLQIDDGALGLVLAIQEPLMDFVGLGELAGGRLVGGNLHRAGVLIAGGDAPLPRDIPLEGMSSTVLVDHLL